MQTITLDDLYSHHDSKNKFAREDSSVHYTDYKGSVIEEDRRLPMFGWNIEALNMLVLPMVKTKSVVILYTYKMWCIAHTCTYNAA